MPKTKEFLDSGDDASSGDEAPKTKKQKVEKKKPAAKKPAKKEESEEEEVEAEVPVENESEEAEEEEEKEVKKKPAAKAAPQKKASTTNKKNDDENGDMYQLGKLRYINVTEFRGTVMVNIREYYESKEGKMLPGKKGISLQLDQWNKLKQFVDKIDADIKKQK